MWPCYFPRGTPDFHRASAFHSESGVRWEPGCFLTLCSFFSPHTGSRHLPSTWVFSSQTPPPHGLLSHLSSVLPRTANWWAGNMGNFRESLSGWSTPVWLRMREQESSETQEVHLQANFNVRSASGPVCSCSFLLPPKNEFKIATNYLPFSLSSTIACCPWSLHSRLPKSAFQNRTPYPKASKTPTGEKIQTQPKWRDVRGFQYSWC